MQGLGTRPPGAAPERPMGRQQIPEANYQQPQAGAGAPQLVQASPEEEAIYREFVGGYLLALYDESMQDKQAQMIREADDPVRVVAEITAALAMRVYAKAQEKGQHIPGDVMLHAAHEALVPFTVEFAESTGIDEFSTEQVEQAFYASVDRFREQAQEAGIYTDEDAIADFEAINGMKESGQLDALMAAMGPENMEAEPGPEAMGAAPGPMDRGR